MNQHETSRLRARRLPARLAVIAGACAAVFGTGVAYAAWTSTGSGNGYAKAGTSTALGTVAISGTAFSGALLYPNGPAADAQITIDNPNPYPVQITAVSGNGAITGTGGAGTCTTTGVSFTNKTGLTISVPAKSGSTDGQTTATLTGAVSMSTSSDDGCRNAVFTIPVTFSGQSN